MAVTPLPALDRTASTFKTDVDTFFAQKLPTFSQEVNTVASAADASASAANTSKNAAATSATNANSSAIGANTSAVQALASAQSALGYSNAASSSSSSASGSATAAGNSATAASNSAATALTQANRAQTAADSIASGPVTSVNGKTGAPVLNKSDIGLSLVDNYSVAARGLLGGGPAVMTSIPNIDDFTTVTNGWYAISATGTTGTKPPGESWGTILVSGRAFQADSRVNQLFFSDGFSKLWFRSNISGTWTAWQDLTRPAKTSMKRRPLTPSEDTLSEVWSHILSIPLYLDKSINASAAASQALDLSSYSIFDFTLTTATTFSISNAPGLAGETLTIVVRIRQGSTAYALSWFSGITWLTPNWVAAPAPAAGKITEYVFSTVNGTAWFGRVGAGS